MSTYQRGPFPCAIVLAATCLAIGAHAGENAENLLPNGGFESGKLDGWKGNAEVLQDEAHSGSKSVRLTGGSITTELKTEPGATYKVIAWVKIAASEGADWGGMRLQASDAKSLAHSDWLNLGSHGKEWCKVALGFKAVSAKTTLNVGFFGGPKKKMVAYFDDLRAFRRDGENRAPQIQPRLDPTASDRLPASQSYDLQGDDPDGAICRVFWDFGDGQRAFEAAGQRRIGLPGKYTATVTAIDDDGAVTRATVAWSAADAQLPQVTVQSPAAAETTVAEPLARLQGTCSGAIHKVLVSSDREQCVPAAGTKAWKAEVRLAPGRNRLLIQAHDDQERIVAAERIVRYVPAGALTISDVALDGDKVEQWDLLTARFQLRNSAATHPQFPYDTDPAPGLKWIDGVSVDAVFTSADGKTTCRRPAFLYCDYEIALKDRDAKKRKPGTADKKPDGQQFRNSEEQWLYPRGEPVWMVRFAPPGQGRWTGRIEAREAKGTAQSKPFAFQVLPPASRRSTTVRSAWRRPTRDTSSTPTARRSWATAMRCTSTRPRCYYDMLQKFEEIGIGNQQLFRVWIAGQVWGSGWFGWISRTHGYDGIVPQTGLNVERGYGDGLASFKLSVPHPIVWQGFGTGHTGLVPGRNYCLRVRWRTEGVDKPERADEPFGVCVKFMGWPDPGKTSKAPAVVPHVHGDTPWHVAEGRFTAEGDFIPNVILVLENAQNGTAYVDECSLYEVRDDGAFGPQLLRSPHANAHLRFEPDRGYALDGIFREAQARGLYIKLVISEKAEFLLGRLGAQGLPDRQRGHFSGGEGSAPRRLHEYHWRHMFARYGAFRAMHSWETVNEDAPEFGGQFRLAAALAKAAAADGNPHPATLSTWASLGKDSWKHPDVAAISYVDFHAYVRISGWLEPKAELGDDSARFMAEYDRAAYAGGFGKPIVWGEVGIDGQCPPDRFKKGQPEEPDGVWLHKFVWARCGAGGVYPLYWYTDNIFRHNLHRIYGAWNRFMQDVPLNNGRYRDAEAKASHADLRVLGQKDLQAGRAHLWIDNRQHTWKAVVDGRQIAPAGGTVTFDMQKPGAAYSLTWYDTATGKPAATVPVKADQAGRITVEVKDLKTDTALHVRREIAGYRVTPTYDTPDESDSPLTKETLPCRAPSAKSLPIGGTTRRSIRTSWPTRPG